MLGDTLSLQDIPGGSQAVQTVVAQLAKWQAVPGQVNRLQAQAMAVQQAGNAAGNVGVVAAMSAVMADLGNVLGNWQGSAQSLSDVLTVVSAQGQGVSVGVLAEAAQLALTITVGLRQVDNDQAQVLAAAQRVMTPEQVAALGVGVTATPARVGTWGKYALAGGLLYGAFAVTRRRRR